MEIFVDGEKQQKRLEMVRAKVSLNNCLEYIEKEIGKEETLRLIEDVLDLPRHTFKYD